MATLLESDFSGSLVTECGHVTYSQWNGRANDLPASASPS
jgi:hypothetical protein